MPYDFNILHGNKGNNTVTVAQSIDKVCLILSSEGGLHNFMDRSAVVGLFVSNKHDN